jgi:cellobiose transport system permease protein
MTIAKKYPTLIQPRRRHHGSGGAEARPRPVVYTFLIVVLLAVAFPFWWTYLIASGNSATTSTGSIPLLPGGYFFFNAMRAIDTVPFWLALLNSLIVSVCVSLSVVVFSTLAGFSFSKLNFRGREGLLVFVIATTAVPTQLSVVPLFIAMAKFGWTGSLWAVMVPTLVTSFGVFWMTQYLRSTIPYELIEAARMDGCNMIRTFIHVGLPAARPAATMLGLFTFVAAWTNFFWPFIVLPPGNPTLPVALQSLEAGNYVDYSLVLAGVVLATIPLVLLFFVAGRQLVNGIMTGAVKG